MHRSICLALDGSAASRRAASAALALAVRLDASVTGIVAAGASSSAERRRRLRALLPAAALGEAARQGEPSRPGGPAGAGDEADWFEVRARVARVAATVERHDGTTESALLAAAARGAHDLVVVGAATGGADGSALAVGATCERLVRGLRADVLVVKDDAEGFLDRPAGLLVALDGSPQSFAGLDVAIALSKRLDRSVEAVAVYDPYLHYTLFNGIVGILSEKASKVFKFKDQEKLHEEIIDTGLAKIYQAHLEVARGLAREQGVTLGVTLLDGKASQKVARHAQAGAPALLVLGRIGVHSTDEMDVGATTEALLRSAPCNVLVTSRKRVPPVELQEAESVQWVPEAREKMDRVPAFVRGVARTAVVRWAIERGHSIITPSVINGCMGEILPPSAAQAMGWVAEELAVKADALAVGKTFVCRECGHASRDYRPVSCPVCKSGSDRFEAIDRAAIEAAGTLAKGAVEEETFDGRALSWTPEAMAVIRRVPNGYERRRSKARIEKTAKVRGLRTITEEFALDMVQQEVAEGAYLSARGERLVVEVAASERPDDDAQRPRDGSPLPWTDAAWKRLSRVPEGFMRDMTRERVEQFAAAAGKAGVDLALCEEGIAEGRRMMAEMIGSYSKGGGQRPADAAPAPEGGGGAAGPPVSS